MCVAVGHPNQPILVKNICVGAKMAIARCAEVRVQLTAGPGFALQLPCLATVDRTVQIESRQA